MDNAENVVDSNDVELDISGESFLDRLTEQNPNKQPNIDSLINEINTGTVDLTLTDFYGDNALIIACQDEGLKEVALALIKIGNEDSNKLDLGYVNKSGDTALMMACYNGFKEVASALIKTGNKSKPENVNHDGETALTYACRNKLEDVALELIATGKSAPGQVANDGLTALILACHSNLEQVALKLIETHHSKPGQIDGDRETALIISCRNALGNVALELIKTGKSKPGQLNNDKDTALIMACHNGLEDVAMALIETGNSKPGQINDYGETALILACKNEMKSVAVALLDIHETNIYHMDKDGFSALDYAIQNNLTTVLAKIPKDEININQTGFSIETQDHAVIQDYLKETPGNIVFLIDGQYYHTTKRSLTKQLTATNVKYGCRKAGNSLQFILEDNVIYDTPYLSLSAVVPLQILIKLEDAGKIIDPLSGNMFVLRNTGLTLPAIVSKDFLTGSSGASSDHCQPEKETDVYGVFVAAPVCGESANPAEKEEIKMAVPGNDFIIMFNQKKYTIPVDQVNSVEDLKNMFLQAIGVSDNKEDYQLRLFFQGKYLYNKGISDDGLFNNIKENPSNSVIQALVTQQKGGNRTKKVKRANRAKQTKRAKRAKQTQRVKKGKSGKPGKHRKTKRR